MMLTSLGQVAAARVPAFLTKFDVPVYKLTDSNGKFPPIINYNLQFPI